MNKSMIKERVLLVFLAVVSLVISFFVLAYLLPLLLSLWVTGIMTLFVVKRKNPKASETKGYQLFEKLLYFQIINLVFAYFFIPELLLIALLIPVVLLILSFNKERRTSDKFIKWAKYVGFHLFNWALILGLFRYFPHVGDDAIVISTLPLITFLNSMTAAIYLMFFKPLPTRGKRIFVSVLLLFIMTGTVLSLFPQESGMPVIEQIFGGN